MNWYDFAFGFLWPLTFGAWRARRPLLAQSVARQWAIQAAGCCIGWAVATLLPHFAWFWNDVAGGAVSLACAVALWLWLRRKNRGKAANALGAKGRALRDALVRKVRESAKPRPALRPVPGGAS